MKKIIFALFIFGIFSLGVYGGQKLSSFEKIDSSGVGETSEKEASLMLDFGNGKIKTFTKLPIGPEETVFSLLKSVCEVNGLILDYSEEPSLGVFVKAIDGQANDFSNNAYWQFWVDNEYSQIGASAWRLKGGEAVEWKLTGASF